ncbi:SDR family oxidoreductase [Conyzicola nivalis]|uniref:Short-chain dehydrogenase n=1 Tax=Conyzicola nivalis TaxID=1477021 RepID=A0A916SA68_9MICO|nr:SDR family oxidoreductase [Conyzicola nivalis]GGA90737.1 short-chain dehydrogenase [Conyzicola nivalis]
MSDLTGKTALVTGSTSGIGRTTAELLAERGAHVILSGRNADRGAAAVQSIVEAGGKADFVAVDLSDISGLTEFAAEVEKVAGGHVDILVNNAGIYPFGPSVDFTPADFDSIYDANVKAVFFLTNALVPAMIENGGGAVVNLSSSIATKGIAGASLYASSKAAVETLTKVWSAEFGPQGVRVNSVSPGPTATEGTEVFGDAFAQYHAGTPADRLGQPREIAAAVAFLVGDDSEYIHGIVLPVDGGALTL